MLLGCEEHGFARGEEHVNLGAEKLCNQLFQPFALSVREPRLNDVVAPCS